jgi:uncharacterized cupredoxin-like copper-binding protein
MQFANIWLASVLAVSASLPARADTTIKVTLWDKPAIMSAGMQMNMGMGMHGNMSMAGMGINVDTKSVPAGKVTFDVLNASKDTIHEMIVSPIRDLNVTLPYVAAESRVDEDASGDIGEVSELDPGGAGSLTIDLKPGQYVLFCNVPGHFSSGMWTTIDVK